MKTRKHSSGHEYEIAPQVYINASSGSLFRNIKPRPMLFIGCGHAVIERITAAQLIKQNRKRP